MDVKVDTTSGLSHNEQTNDLGDYDIADPVAVELCELNEADLPPDDSGFYRWNTRLNNFAINFPMVECVELISPSFPHSFLFSQTMLYLKGMNFPCETVGQSQQLVDQ